MPKDKLWAILDFLWMNAKTQGMGLRADRSKDEFLDDTIRKIGELGEWMKGEPKEAMWCLVTYLTNDDPPNEAVDMVWFNPDALPKWWIGNIGTCIEFNQIVTHWMELPESANYAIILAQKKKRGNGK